MTAAKPYATAHISIFFFFYCWEYPVSSSTLVLVHPLKINHLLKANSFLPCLGTLPSHLDNKDGKRDRWRIPWDGEEYSKTPYFTWVINNTFLNAHWDFWRAKEKKLVEADLDRVTMTFYNCCWRTACVGSGPALGDVCYWQGWYNVTGRG